MAGSLVYVSVSARGAVGTGSLGDAGELALERLHRRRAGGDRGGGGLDVDGLARGIRERDLDGAAERGVRDGGHREGHLALVGRDDRWRGRRRR